MAPSKGMLVFRLYIKNLPFKLFQRNFIDCRQQLSVIRCRGIYVDNVSTPPFFCDSGTGRVLSRIFPLKTNLYRKPSSQYSCLFSTSSIFHKKRKTESEKTIDKIAVRPNKAKIKSQSKVITVWKNMTVQELATSMEKDIDDVFDIIITYLNNADDYDGPHKQISNIYDLQEIIKLAGMRCQFTSSPSTHVGKEATDVFKRIPANPADCVPRHPVVTIMGHVDHGKTSLLDYLRNSHVVDQEFGGITQHIGAFEVRLNSGETITFLDTPGHAAFTAMRSRGAQATDIVILVVAADDGVMEQTIESIRLANEANVPMIIAINKIDKPEADIERTKRMLVAQGVMLEEAGGDVQVVPVSALKGTGVNELIEAINTQAVLLDLKADPRGFVEGVVIESKSDPYRGKLSTAIVQRGTLRRGSILVAGTAWAKVRAMFNDRGQPIQEAPPSTPVEIVGWRELPSAGDEILEVESEKRAASVIDYRRSIGLENKALEDSVIIQKKYEEARKEYLAHKDEKRRIGYRKFGALHQLHKKERVQEESKMPKVSIVLKGDVDGSVEAILDVLETYNSSQCQLDLLHYGVGSVSENDIKMAEAFEGIVYTFNVPTSANIQSLARSQKVPIKDHNIIYRLVDDLREELSKKLLPIEVEEVVGEANVQQEFIITEGREKVRIAGCRCIKGQLRKSGNFRVTRHDEIVFDGPVSSMRHLKNEVESVKKDVECGIRFQDTSFEIKPGDTVICYQMKSVKQVSDWDPGF